MARNRENSRMVPGRAVIAFGIAIVGLTALVATTAGDGDWAVTRRVVGVPYEVALKDYVERLSRLDGVTSATYREYDPLAKTARVTVTYDPRTVDTEVIEAWLGNTTSMWEESVQI